MGLHNLGLDVHLYDKLFKMTSNGQKGVDFFFILSGLFLYMSMIKLPEQPLFPFVCKKIIRLWPVMVFATLLAFVLSLFGLLKFTYWDNIYALLFLNGTPLAINQGNISVTWYCSALMVHFILFFYLFQNVPRKYFWLIVCILIYVSYGVILQAKNFNINDQKQTFGYIFHVGMMRASGGIGIGLLLGYWYASCKVFIEKYHVTMMQKLAITTIEFVTLYFMINNLMLHKFQHHNQFMFIIDFTVLVGCFLMNKGYISALFNRELFPKLSKYIYSIFVTHQIVINVLRANL
jgi:peptidoglycan/LPS O-acetylase OafA/YrhL